MLCFRYIYPRDLKDTPRPVKHKVKSLLFKVTMEPRQVPGEIAHTMQLTKDRKTYLPILYIDELSMRQRELVKVNATDEVGEVKVVYRPISFGKLRLFLQFSSALTSMQGMGFTEKDTDEVKLSGSTKSLKWQICKPNQDNQFVF